jgi:hypothetical protein
VPPPEDQVRIVTFGVLVAKVNVKNGISVSDVNVPVNEKFPAHANGTKANVISNNAKKCRRAIVDVITPIASNR